MQAEVKDAYWAIFDTGDLTIPPGPRLVQVADSRIDAFVGGYKALYPAAVKILLPGGRQDPAHRPGGPDRLPALPRRAPQPDPALQLHRANLRRNTPRGQGHRPAPGETSCLTLVWAVLDRASRGWRGFTLTSDGLRLLQDLRRSLPEPPRPLRPRAASTAGPGDQAGTVRASA